jgi:flavin-dependent dehydrogenase
VIQNRIGSGIIHSPSGREVTLNANGLELVVLDRSAYDKQLAESAESRGAELRTGSRAIVERETRSGVDVKVGNDLVESRYYVDATGPSSLPRAGILSAAKYEIEANWVRDREVEIFVDAQKYPGFFAWVIPYGRGLAKVGAAGHRMNAFAALDSFLEARPHNRLRRVAAPIYVGGPVDRFVVGNTVKVGESAGQVKPTTAGGIMTSLAGAVIAAKWLSDSIQLGDPERLANYQPDWESRFLREMKSMLRLRGVFEKLSNADLDSIVSTLSSPRLLSRLSRSDFDFHASAFLEALGVPGLLRVAKVVASAEAKSLLMAS